MGNDESKAKDAHSMLDDYFVKKKVTDIRYGFSTLLEHKLTKEIVILKEINTNLEKDFKTSLLKWEYKMKLQHPNIIQVLGVNHRSERTYCSTFFKIYILFEMIVKDLEEEIEEKSQKDDPYTETELWFLIDSLLNGLYYLQLSGTCHGALRPSSVYLGYNGFYKIAEHTLFNEPPSYSLVQCSPNANHKGVYLSPNMMASIFNRELHPVHDPYKSDIFSAGMLLIHAALLKPCDDIYNFDTMDINENVLESKLKIIRDKYSKNLSGILEKMLELDEEKRYNYEQLIKVISELEVRNGQKFKEMENSAISTFFFTKNAENPYESTNSKLKRSAYYYDTKRKRVNVQSNSNLLNPQIIVLSPNQGFPDDNRIKFVSTEKVSKKFKSSDKTPPEFEALSINNSPVSSFISSSNKELSDLFAAKPNFNEKKQNNWRNSIPSRGTLDSNVDNIIAKYAGENLPRRSRKYSGKPVEGRFGASGNAGSPSKRKGKDAADSRIREQSRALKVATPKQNDILIPKIQEFSNVVVEFYQNGAHYEGEKLNNKRHGKGKFFYADGGHYEGAFKENKMDGEGNLYYSNGKLAYKGRFQNDEFEGFGNLINDMPMSSLDPLDYKNLGNFGDFWISYEGEFSNGEKSGFGVLLFTSGEKYSGQFNEDLPHGKGSFYLKNGQVVSGYWERGRMR